MNVEIAIAKVEREIYRLAELYKPGEDEITEVGYRIARLFIIRDFLKGDVDVETLSQF